LRTASAILWVALVVLAAACSGGGGSGPAGGSSAASGARTARFTIVIPAPASAASEVRRRPTYISPSTVTLVVTAIYGTASPAPGEAVDVSPGSSACVAGSGGARSCTVSVAVQTGATELDVAALDANKHLLAHALVTLPAVSAPVIDITITLGGDPASVVLAIEGGEFAQGYAGTKTLDITALDADGNTIGLPGAFDLPISLTVSDGAISVSPATIVDPGQTATITYDGSPGANSVITASVVAQTGIVTTTTAVQVVGTGSPPPTATPGTTPTPTPLPQVSAIIIINGLPRH
jgi:hypothetical protein